MPTSEARIRANQANAFKSTEPKTPEGKEASRANAVKHGLTGDGVALPPEVAAEVDRLQASFEAELKPSGDLGRTLVRRMALMSARMDRCVAQESASLAVRVREAGEAFDAEWPAVDGVADPERARRRDEATKLALFDPCKAATLARKYEASAERGFFRALKELRQVERQAKVSDPGQTREALGSFLKGAASLPKTTPKPAEPARSTPPSAVVRASAAPQPRPKPLPDLAMDLDFPPSRSFDLPFSIGRVG